MVNIINAIINLVENPKIELIRKGSSTNRANNMGEALEEYIKDLFAGTLETTDRQERLKILKTVFAYLGNQNNPPDIMLYGGNKGDAVEVKKLENFSGDIALNSSYPKAKLFSDNTRINQEAKECEDWNERDMLYAIGFIPKNSKELKHLTFAYGEDFCARKEIYENIESFIKTGIEELKDQQNLEFSESNELGHIKRVDPLGVTYFRIRGMWGIQNPIKIFSDAYHPERNHRFTFMCIMNTEKFDSFENTQNLYKLAQKDNRLKIEDVKIKNPNNPASLKDAKLITFYVEAQQ